MNWTMAVVMEVGGSGLVTAVAVMRSKQFRSRVTGIFCGAKCEI